MCVANRQRRARVQILQEQIDRIRQVIARACFCVCRRPEGATGVMVKDYRGKSDKKYGDRIARG